MNASDHNTQSATLVDWVWVHQPAASTPPSDFAQLSAKSKSAKPKFDLFQPVRKWLDSVTVNNAEMARSICKFIPSQCPFEREVKLFGRTVLRIPPLCKLNPVYDEVVALRFRALCYLADVCGEDITAYC